MGYGIEIRGKDGGLLLDSDYHLLKFVGKGTDMSKGVSGGGGALGVCYQAYVRSPALSLTSEPAVFVNIESGKNISVDRIWADDATHRSMQLSSSYDFYPDVYWFENKEKAASDDDYGLLVYDASANLLFDSGWYKKDLLNVVNIKSLTATLGQSMTVDARITKPAFMFRSTYGRWYRDDPPYLGWFKRMAVRRTSAVFSLEEIFIVHKRFTYGNAYAAQTWSDGRTYPVPVIDGTLYD